MFLLTTTLLFSLLPFVKAQTATRTSTSFSTPVSSPLPTPTQSIVLSHLIPPYGPGSAHYYASVIREAPGNGTYFEITCIPGPTGTSGFEIYYTDPCLTAYLGTGSQTFHQGNGYWTASRAGTLVDVEGSSTRWLHRDSTICTWARGPSTSTGTPNATSIDIRNALCTAEISTRGTKNINMMTATGKAGEQFGLKAQNITITAGFGELAERTRLVTPAQFTDLGNSDTIAPPKTTVTLFIQPGQGSSTNVKVSLPALLVVSLSCLWFSMLP